MKKEIWFDIDGVLNNTPQLGGRAPWIRQDLWEKLQVIAEQSRCELVCISFHRSYDGVVAGLLGDDSIRLAKIGVYKMHAVPEVHDHILVIDDQPAEYHDDVDVYAVDGTVGLTPADFLEISRIVERNTDLPGVD